jgi:DNA mismatch repair protein MutL
MISFFYDGDGMKVGGLVAHPKHHAPKTNHIYMFVNNRPIYDNGIVKSVMQGLARFMPHGEKVPFIISIQVNPSQVDVNVHPRKEEIRFINPYRIYSAIEMAVTSAVQKELKDENIENITDYSSSNSSSEIGFSRLRGAPIGERPASYDNSYPGTKELNFRKPNEFNIHESIEFSKQLLKDTPQEGMPRNNSLFDSAQESPTSKPFSYYQIFNKYIIVEYQDQIWIVDQHAADERINYERLMKSLLSETKNSQKLFVANEVELSKQEISFISENIKFFLELGFELKLRQNSIAITAVPTEIVGADYSQVFKVLFELDQSSLDLKNNFEKAKQDMIATIACHSSVRKGQKLNPVEMKAIVENLQKCENPYSCPHGRPAIWKQKIEEIDKHFLRTY